MSNFSYEPSRSVPEKIRQDYWSAVTVRDPVRCFDDIRETTCSLKNFVPSFLSHPIMSLEQNITLSTGASLRQIGLGTWLSKPKEVENAVSFICSRMVRCDEERVVSHPVSCI